MRSKRRAIESQACFFIAHDAALPPNRASDRAKIASKNFFGIVRGIRTCATGLGAESRESGRKRFARGALDATFGGQKCAREGRVTRWREVDSISHARRRRDARTSHAPTWHRRMIMRAARRDGDPAPRSDAIGRREGSLKARAWSAAARSPPADWPCRPRPSSPGRRTSRSPSDLSSRRGPCRDCRR